MIYTTSFKKTNSGKGLALPPWFSSSLKIKTTQKNDSVKAPAAPFEVPDVGAGAALQQRHHLSEGNERNHLMKLEKVSLKSLKKKKRLRSFARKAIEKKISSRLEKTV